MVNEVVFGGNRDREFIGKYKPVELKKEKAKYSAIIPVSEEKRL